MWRPDNRYNGGGSWDFKSYIYRFQFGTPVCNNVVDRPHQLAEHQGAMEALVESCKNGCGCQAASTLDRVGAEVHIFKRGKALC